MRSPSSFSFADLCASFVLVMLVMGLSLAVVGCGISKRDKHQSMTQVRGIIQGMINFAPGNNEWYPGINHRGQEDTTQLIPAANFYGVTGKTGYDPAFRYALMIRNNYFSPDWIVSPIDFENVKAATLKPEPGSNQKPGVVTANNFSFAMLELASGKGRNGEWKSTTNSKAAVVSDRNIGADADANTESLAGSPWNGAVGFNDNHINWEESHIVANLQYGYGNQMVKQDNLFKTGDKPEGDPTKQAPDPDALMTYKSANDGGANQQP